MASSEPTSSLSSKLAHLFGVDSSLEDHRKNLKRAEYFSQIRRRLEEDQRKLGEMSNKAWKNSTKRNLFIKNVVAAVHDERRRSAVLPFLEQDTPAGCSPNSLFILACFSLHENDYRTLIAEDLERIFPPLVKMAIKPFKVCLGILEKIMTIIDDEWDESVTGKPFHPARLDPTTAPDGEVHSVPDASTPESQSVSRTLQQLHSHQIEVRREKRRREETDDASTSTSNLEPRVYKFSLSGADVYQVENVLGPDIFKAIASSNQWNKERRTADPSTDCLMALIFNSEHDFSFMIRVGYDAGMKVIKKLGFCRSDILELAT